MLKLGSGRFDAAVIGGGIYGILLALEGASRGQRVLLLEQNDFGSGVTFNHLRTIHGGLRYLQSLDIRRAVASNRQRLWWLRNFPDLIHPISCLMPLYGEGMKRPEIFQAAFLLARSLGLQKGAGSGQRQMRLISTNEVRTLLPCGRERGLDRGALWQDAFMPRPHRIVAELLHWAESAGAVVLNRTEFLSAVRLPARHRGDAWRLSLRNRRTGEVADIATRWIVNASGPAAGEVMRRMVGGAKRAVLVPTLAWGLLLDRPPLSSCSVAVAPPGGGRRTYFIHPYHGRVLAGTGHSGLPVNQAAAPAVSETQLLATLRDLNEALPDARLTRDEVSHLFYGVLPGVRPGAEYLLRHSRIIDHAADGAAGALSVLGVKFTEAPFMACRVWNRLAGQTGRHLPPRPAPVPAPSVGQARQMSDEELSGALQCLVETEWQPGAEDLAWRRTDLWMDATQARRVSVLEPRWNRPESG